MTPITFLIPCLLIYLKITTTLHKPAIMVKVLLTGTGLLS